MAEVQLFQSIHHIEIGQDSELTKFTKYFLLLGKYSLLSLAKNWTNNFAIW